MKHLYKNVKKTGKKGINLKIQAGKKKKPGKLQKFKITTFWCMGY